MYVIVGIGAGVSALVGPRLWIKRAVDTAPSKPGTSPLGVNWPMTVTSPSPLSGKLSSLPSLPESVGSGGTDVNCPTTLLRSVNAEVLGSAVGSGVDATNGVSVVVISLVNEGESVDSSVVNDVLEIVGSTLVENSNLLDVVDSSVVNDSVGVLVGVAVDDHVLEVVGF